MADINVNVVLPDPISVDVTSPTQALATNVSVPGPQGPAGPRGFTPLINGITGDSILFSGKDGIIISSDQSVNTIYVSGNSGYFQLAVNSLINNLQSTGSILDNRINFLSGVSVLEFGDQTIDGLKDFTTRPTVNTVPVLLSGENANGLSVLVKNDDSITLQKGQPVYIYGAAGNNILVRAASNSGENTSSKTLGLLNQTLAPNAQGYVITEGGLEGVDTNSANAGDPIWLGPTGSLIYGLVNKPYAPNNLVYLGVVERKQANNGKIYVKIQNGFELEELHNVNINHTYTLNNNDILQYNSTSGLWFNQPLNTGIFVTKSNGQFTNRPTVNGTGILLSGEAASLPDTIVYTTGNQNISGNKTFIEDLTVQKSGFFWSGIKVGLNSVIITDQSIKINNDPVVLQSEFTGYTGNAANIFSTIINLQNTGSTLNSKINSLSGYVNSQDTSISNNLISTGSTLDNKINSLSGWSASAVNLTSTGATLITNLFNTGSNLNIKIDNLSGYVNTQDNAISTNLRTTGSTLDDKINSLSGVSVLTYGNQTILGNKTFDGNTYINNLFVTGAQTIVSTNNFSVQSPYLLLNLTGGAVDGGIFFVTGNGLTGLNDFGPIIGFDHSKNFKFGISTRASDLSSLPDIASVQQIETYSGFVDNKYATIINLESTGSTLQTNINNLSGYINSTDSNIVFTTGDQAIAGQKIFHDQLLVDLATPDGSVQNNKLQTTSLLVAGQNLTQGGQIPSTVIRGATFLGNADGTIGMLTNTHNVWGPDVFEFAGVNFNVTQYKNLYFTAGYFPQFWLSTNGNVGIHTAYPSERLEVNGNVLANNLLYNTGNQTIYGIKTFDVAPILNGNPLITGIDLSNYATVINLADTGSTLNSKINSLSGWSASATNLASTGSTLDTKINNLSGVSVLTFGNQTINGTKTFNSGVVINVQPTGTNPALYITGTWNNASQVYTGIGLNVTDVSSNGSSNLIDLQVGGTSRFAVNKNGNVWNSAGGFMANSIFFLQIGGSDSSGGGGTARFWVTNSNGAVARQNLGIHSSNGGGAFEVAAYAGGPNIWEQRNGTNPQQFRVYNSTGTNSGEFGLFGWQNNNLIIGSQATSSGILRDTNIVGRNVNINPSSGGLIISAQPTGVGINPAAAVLVTGTWNNASQVYTGISINITDTASNANSLLMDLRAAGTSRFTIGKYGNISAINTVGGTADHIFQNTIGSNNGFRFDASDSSNAGFRYSYYGFALYNSALGFTASSNTTVPDLTLNRDAAGILAQRNGTNAQQFRVYNSTGTNSGEFGLFGWDTGNNLIIGSQSTNSGILRNVFITGSNININSNSNINLNPSIANNGYVTLNGGGTYLMVINGGVNQVALGKHPLGSYDGLHLTQGRYVTWSSSQVSSNSPYLFLTDDGANILAQRSPASPLSGQQFRVYNATGTNSGEFGLFGWQNNQLIVGSQVTNSGILRDTNIVGRNININPSSGGLIISAQPTGVGINPAPAVFVTGTWNNASQIYTGIALDVVDTNSNSSSSLMDLKVGGTSQFYVRKDGSAFVNTSAGTYLIGNNPSSQVGIGRAGGALTLLIQGGSTQVCNFNGSNVTFQASSLIQWSSDTTLARDAAGILAQRNGTNAQQFRVYNATGTNSGEFGLVGWVNSGLVIGPQQTTSGILRDLTLTGNNININASGVLNIFDNTNIVGNLTVSGNTTITGHLSASSKSFLIDHPTQANKKLQYGSLEGPEHGVFVRGKTNANIINLPNYWSALVDENSISVNLTPISAANNIYVVDYNNQRIITSGNNNNDYFYTVYGERKDIPKLVVEF